MPLEENKYYICSNKTSSDDLLYPEGFSDIEDAIIKAREIANQDTSSYCIYIQPTERQGQVELMNAEYVISVNGGVDDTGCYTIDEEINNEA